MAIYRYEELGENQMDVFREIGSIGNGNAITALFRGILSGKRNQYGTAGSQYSGI